MSIDVSCIVQVVPSHIDGRVHLVQLRSSRYLKAIQAIAFLQVITHHYDGDVPAIAAESIVAGFICPSTKNTGCCAIFSYKSAQTGEQAGDTAQGIVFDILPSGGAGQGLQTTGTRVTTDAGGITLPKGRAVKTLQISFPD